MDKKLLDYIKQSKKQGFSDERIKKALSDAGWKEEDIDEGMKNVGGETSNIEPDSSASKPFFLKKKLPGWVFLLFAIGSAVIIVLIAWQSIIILSEIQQTSVDIAESSKNIQRENQFADWQTYRNEEYGFEFKYPRGWEINQKEPYQHQNYLLEIEPEIKRIIWQDPEGNDVVRPGIVVYESIYDYKDEKEELDFVIIGDLEKVNIDGVSGFKKFGEIREHIGPFGDKKTRIVLDRKDSVLIFSLYPYDENIFNQVLSTFKFLPR